jgi:hypothetical protein
MAKSSGVCTITPSFTPPWSCLVRKYSTFPICSTGIILTQGSIHTIRPSISKRVHPSRKFKTRSAILVLTRSWKNLCTN